ncbi:uncharacterized protein [Ptychodera flava]|uniref:uncharacterized protein n=1 Tax=Ptychodera flava TaxID=63121 RepID=UPI003969E647
MMASAIDDLLGEWDLRDNPLPEQCVDQLSAILDKEDSSGLNWQTFATYLGFPESLTDEIRQLSLGGLSPTKCVLELYENAVPWPTWRDFHVAVRTMDQTEAEAILIQHSSSERYSSYSQDEIVQFTNKWKNPLNLDRALKTDNLSGECVKAVSAKLNRPHILGRDWKGLARALGFDDDVIQIIRNERNRTQAVCDLYQANNDATLGKLYNALREIGRIDVIYIWIYYEIILVTDSASESRHDKAPQLLDKWDLRDYPLQENCITELASHLDMEHNSGLNWRMFAFYLGFDESGIETIDKIFQSNGLSPTKIVLEMYAHLVLFPTWQSVHSALRQIDQLEAEGKLIEFGRSRRRCRYSEAEVIHFLRSLKNPSNLERKLQEIRLSDKCVEAVSVVLNSESDLFEVNWKVLAKKLGFDNEVIAMISDHDANERTQMLLDMYQAGDNATLGKLYSAIQNIHRIDVIYLLWKYNELVLTEDSEEKLTGDGNTSNTTTSPEDNAADTSGTSNEGDCVSSAKSVEDDESLLTMTKDLLKGVSSLFKEAKEAVKDVAGAVIDTLDNVETVEFHMKENPDGKGKREKRSRSDSSGSIVHHQYNIHGGNVIIGDHGKIGYTSLDGDAEEDMTCDENGADKRRVTTSGVADSTDSTECHSAKGLHMSRKESSTSSAEEAAVDREQVLRNMGFEVNAIRNALDTFPEDPVDVIATYLAETQSGHCTGDDLLLDSTTVSAVESGSNNQLECSGVHQTSPSVDVSNVMVANPDAEVLDTIQGEALAVSRGSPSDRNSGDIVQDKEVKSEKETVIDKKRLLQDMGFEENSVDEALFLFPEDDVHLIATYLSETQTGENIRDISTDKERRVAEETKRKVQGPTVQETSKKECHQEGKDDLRGTLSDASSHLRHSRLQTETSLNEEMLDIPTDHSIPSTQQAEENQHHSAGSDGRLDKDGNVTTDKEQVLVARGFDRKSVIKALEILPEDDIEDVASYLKLFQPGFVQESVFPGEASSKSESEETDNPSLKTISSARDASLCSAKDTGNDKNQAFVRNECKALTTSGSKDNEKEDEGEMITVNDDDGGNHDDSDNGNLVADDKDTGADSCRGGAVAGFSDNGAGGIIHDDNAGNGAVCDDKSSDGIGIVDCDGICNVVGSGEYSDGAGDDKSTCKGTVYGDDTVDNDSGGIVAVDDSSGDVNTDDVSGEVGTVCGGSSTGGDAFKDGSVGYGVVDDGSGGKSTVDDISYGDGGIDDNNCCNVGGDSSSDINTDDISSDIGTAGGGGTFKDGSGDDGIAYDGSGANGSGGKGIVDGFSDVDVTIDDDNGGIAAAAGDSGGDVNTDDISDDVCTVAVGSGSHGAFDNGSTLDATNDDASGGGGDVGDDGDGTVAVGSGCDCVLNNSNSDNGV